MVWRARKPLPYALRSWATPALVTALVGHAPLLKPRTDELEVVVRVFVVAFNGCSLFFSVSMFVLLVHVAPQLRSLCLKKLKTPPVCVASRYFDDTNQRSLSLLLLVQPLFSPDTRARSPGRCEVFGFTVRSMNCRHQPQTSCPSTMPIGITFGSQTFLFGRKLL